MEARSGIEPLCKALQAPTSPLCHRAIFLRTINLLLTSLNYYFKKRSFVKFNKIRCIFIHAVKINKDVDFVLEDNSKNTIIRIISGSKIYALIILLKGNDLREKFTTNNEHYNIINKINKNYINKSFNKIKKSNRNYKINLYNFKLTSTYNNLKKFLNNFQIKEILSLSYFVGMVCPGFNSILSSIDINFSRQGLKT